MELFSKGETSICREIVVYVLRCREILGRGGIAVLAFAEISTRREFSVYVVPFREILGCREVVAKLLHRRDVSAPCAEWVNKIQAPRRFPLYFSEES